MGVLPLIQSGDLWRAKYGPERIVKILSDNPEFVTIKTVWRKGKPLHGAHTTEVERQRFRQTFKPNQPGDGA